MRVFTIALLFLLTAVSANAQRLCGTAEYIKTSFTPDPVLEYGVKPLPARDTTADEIIVVPVVVHVLFNNSNQQISDAQVLSQLEVLNKDFRLLNTDRTLVPAAFKKFAADAKIVFCLAKVDPEGRPTSGIVKKYTGTEFFTGDDAMKFTKQGGSDAWDSKRYLNIWVCELFGRSLGYATPPGGPVEKDGVVLKHDVFGTVGALRPGFNKGRTATHEVAHWLGLKHIWGEDECGDDGVFDTPRQSNYNFGCPTFPTASTCSPDANGDMYMNFMDLTDDACMQMFTAGQKIRMRSLFAIGGLRNSILLSYQCDSSLASGAALPQDSLPGAAKPFIVKVYPNPVVSELHVDAGEFTTLTGMSATLYTVAGRPIAKFILRSDKETLNLFQVPAGVYILKVGTGAEQHAFKVIKL